MVSVSVCVCVRLFVRLFVITTTLEPFKISTWNFYGSKIWLKARTSSKMAAFQCTAVRRWWFNISDVLVYVIFWFVVDKKLRNTFSFLKLVSPIILSLLYLLDIGLIWIFNKSWRLRFGRRCDIVCEAVTSSCNRKLPWVSNMRYLGVHFVKSRTLKYSLYAAKRWFYRAANSIFGKIGTIASEEVVLQLIKSKCSCAFVWPRSLCS